MYNGRVGLWEELVFSKKKKKKENHTNTQRSVVKHLVCTL